MTLWFAFLEFIIYFFIRKKWNKHYMKKCIFLIVVIDLEKLNINKSFIINQFLLMNNGMRI